MEPAAPPPVIETLAEKVQRLGTWHAVLADLKAARAPESDVLAAFKLVQAAR